MLKIHQSLHKPLHKNHHIQLQSLLYLCVFSLGSFNVGAKEVHSLKQSFDVNGVNLYIECYGEGSPTVVVHSGFNGYGSSGGWQPVIDKLGEGVRICLYDRANLGKSGQQQTHYNFRDAAIQLHSLLNQAKVKPPFILAGHSYGSYSVRIYNDLYPEQVKGILLVDPSQYGQWQNKLSKWRPEQEQYSQKLIDHRQEELEYWHNPSKNREKLDIKANAALITKAADFGDKPYVLIWAKGSDVMNAKPSQYWAGHEPVYYRMKAMFDKSIAAMTKLSSNTRVVYANTDKHQVYYYDPALVAEQIGYLVSTVK